MKLVKIHDIYLNPDHIESIDPSGMIVDGHEGCIVTLYSGKKYSVDLTAEFTAAKVRRSQK